MSAPALVVGDWNLDAADVAGLADKVDGQLIVGHGVDHGLAAGAVVVESVRRDLPRYGSDHAPVLLTVTVDGQLLRVLWWNVYVGQAPLSVLRAVSELVDAHQPHVVALTEADRCRHVLRQVAGYRRFQGIAGEAAGVAVLVRRDVDVVGHGWVRMLLPWTGPKLGKPHRPRAYLRLRLRVGHGAVLRFMAVHLPTGGYHGRNAAAVRESVHRVVTWVTR